MRLKSGGALRDIAPTMLGVLGKPQPADMTGTTILRRRIPAESKTNSYSDRSRTASNRDHSNETGNLRVASVYGVAAEAGDGGVDSARWPEMRVVHLPNYDALPQELPDTNIFVGYSLRAEQLVHARELKWIHSTAAGVAQLMYPELRHSGITVTNASGIFSVPMAEHTMGLILAMARNFPDSVR